MAKTIKRRFKKTIIFQGFSLLCFILSSVCLFFLYRLSILPTLFFLLVCLFFLGFNFLLYRLVVSKNWKKRMIGFFITFLFICGLGVGIFYESVTLGFFIHAFQSRERLENYQVLVLNSSNYGSLKEFKNGKIGVPASDFSEGAKLLQNELKQKTSLTLQEYDNSTLVESLLQKNLRVIVMEEAQKNLFMEINEDFQKNVKVIETIPIKLKNNVKKKDTELLKKPFHIYISGSDDYGMINQVSRSDMNMLITVNPLSHKILVTSIPRDYYIDLVGIRGAKDKLTHASLYGIDTSLQSLERLFDISIDYYAKINFSSLVNLVDSVGGIDVVSDSSFVAHYFDEPVSEWVSYSYTEGLNHLNGKQALAFARERKSFLLGDRVRAMHQQMVLSALFDKILSPSIIKNYPDLLNALNGSFDTNLNYEDILSVFQHQIAKNPSWELSNFILEGIDGSEKVYSMPKTNTYVMIPEEESVNKAREEIQNILKDSN